MRWIDEFSRRAMFEPPWWAIVLNPHFLSRRALAKAMLGACPELGGKVLDVGCGIQPYRQLLTSATSVAGLELDTPENRLNKQADVYYDGHRIPFEAGSFDGVLCNQVLEHVFDPASFLLEIARVIAPGGKLILSVPFVWPEHERPFDARRFTSHGLEDLLLRTGFERTQHRKLVGGWGAIFALAAESINTLLADVPRLVRILARIGLITPLNLAGALGSACSGADPQLYLDNFVVAHRKKDGKLVEL